MAEQNKILTVSYGTFSCTLEGFEDSFSTMKAIAEYFRDLAADDRYFGAEPPTPDAEMLTRIAEREIERRVEARTSEDGIVLRASNALAAPTEAPADAAAPSELISPDTGSEPAAAGADDAAAEELLAGSDPVLDGSDDAVSPDQADAADVVEDHETAEDTAAPETAVAKSSAIAGAMAGLAAVSALTERAPEPEADATDDLSEAADAETQSDDVAAAEVAEEADVEVSEDADVEDAVVEVAEVAEASADEEADADAAEAIEAVSDIAPETADEPEAEVAEVEPAPEPAVDPDSVAAKLQRIRAVVGQGAALTDPDTEAADEAISATSDDNPAAPSAVAALIAGQDEADGEAAADAAEDVAEVEPTPIRARVVRMDRDIVSSGDVTADISAVDDLDLDDEFGAEPTSDDSFEGLAALDGADEYDVDLDVSEGDLDADLLEELAQVEEEQAGIDLDADADIEDLTDMADMMAMDGVEPEDSDDETVAELAFEEEAPLELVDPIVPVADLDADDVTEDDAETAEADAAVLDDDAEIDADDSDPENVFAESADDQNEAVDVADLDLIADTLSSSAADDDDLVPAAADRFGHGTDADDEAAISRLLSEADAKMNEPEGRGRRDAISHLKAAVAAKEAARQLGEEDTSRVDAENAFRDDLNMAVQPDAGTAAATEETAAAPEDTADSNADASADADAPAEPRGPVRPRSIRSDRPRSERPRPAPLKLVAAQRVDGDATPAPERSSEPVQPRRVRESARVDTQPDLAGFPVWAEERGAHGLTDLIEAAAEHCVDVEGAEDFARPMVIRKVRAALGGTTNREDELRAFGTLLRQGRFEKVRAGRFRLVGGSRFAVEPQAAQG